MLRRFVLAIILLLSIQDAHAGPAIAVVASVAASAGATLLAQAFIQIVATVLLSALARALGPSPPQLIRDLQVPTSKPPYRTVYGSCRIFGSWAPVRVHNGVLYGCLILNSRPSESVDKIYMDRRELQLTGDMHDFAGQGATATNAPFVGTMSVNLPPPFGREDVPFVTLWVGLGDQEGPPDRIVAEAPDLFQETDAWKGRTVLWVRLARGPNKSRADRWPNVPPEIEVEGHWTKVWDPRESDQDPGDSSTWEWADNQALCLLDALRTNPIRRYGLSSLLVDTFSEAADIADESVERKYSSEPEKRYTVNGVIIWNGAEIIDQVAPLELAGAGNLVRAGGRLGYAPGAWQEPSYTITDVLADAPIEYDRWLPSRDIPNAFQALYVSPDRDWQEQTLPYITVPGMPDPVDDAGVRQIRLGMVTSPTQAMRIQQILARRAGAQKRLSCVLPPAAFNVVAGAVVQTNLPSGFTRLNGLWQVQSCSPGLWASDIEGGVAMRIPVTLAEAAESHYAWDPDHDEFQLVDEEFDGSIAPLEPPTNLQATSGESTAQGQIPRIRFSFEPSVSTATDSYEWEWKESGSDTVYQAGGPIDSDVVDDEGRGFDFLSPVLVGTEYDIRVRAVAPGQVSEWVEVTGVLAQAPAIDVAPPFDGDAVGGVQEITVSWATPNDPNFLAIEFWGSDDNDLQNTTLLELRYTAPSSRESYLDGNLDWDQTRYYWARSRGPFGSASEFVGPVDATTAEDPELENLFFF